MYLTKVMFYNLFNLTLGQIKVEDHSNEITAIPALLELIDLSGAIITIDGMGTQTEILRLIREKKADYILFNYERSKI